MDIPSPPITINLAEREYPLRLAHADLALAEFRSGVSIMDSSDFWNLTKAATYKISLLAWAAILWFKPNIELEEIRQEINFANQAAIADAVNKVLRRDVYPVMERIRAQQEQAAIEDPSTATTGSASAASPSITST